ncbi:hypothetical protein H2509_01095 [Stappia sp. F7233]|uniref:Uncharacterized protein n=1 Tax=Stappia albiluteola TaxID=2758565 RepID=A0A839A9A5_9HYPH|nr:hypothetical protein [Stappia albiluteola]MBA5775715.1 hypothetical protein [Stappia albiluteola]
MAAIGSSSGFGYRKLYATSSRQKTTVYQDLQQRRLKRQQAEKRLQRLQVLSSGITNVNAALNDGQNSILYNRIIARIKAEAEARFKKARTSLDISI